MMVFPYILSVSNEFQLPDEVRERLAQNFSESGAPEKTALDAAIAGSVDPVRLDAIRVSNSPALTRWFSAFNEVANRTATGVYIGDSTTEGVGRADVDSRWLNLLRDLLRGGEAGGANYVSAYYKATSLPDGWTWAGGVQEVGPDVSAGLGWGLGLKAAQLPPGSSMSRTFTGTSFRLFYTESGAGFGDFTVTIDGGSPETVTPAVTVRNDGAYFDSGDLGAGSHTVVVARSGSSGANPIIHGSLEFNGDEMAGVIIVEAARSGMTARVTAENLQAYGALATLQPDLVNIDLGINDWRQGRTVAEYVADMRAIITHIRSLCSASISVTIPHEPNAGSSVVPWSDYVTALRDLAAGDPGVALIDIYLLSGNTSPESDPLGIIAADDIHLSEAGEEFYADQMFALLNRGAGASASAEYAPTALNDTPIRVREGGVTTLETPGLLVEDGREVDVASGTARWVEGLGGAALAWDFDGTWWIRIAGDDLRELAAPMCIEAIVKPTANVVAVIAGVFRDITSPAQSRYGLWRTSAADARFSVVSDTDTFTTRNSAGALPVGVTKHIAGSLDGTTQRMFVDGSVASSAAYAATLNTVDDDALFSIGGSSDGAGLFTGQVGAVRVSTVARYTAAFTAPTALTRDADTLFVANALPPSRYMDLKYGGLLLTSPDGSRWLVRPDDSGNLTASAWTS